MNLRIRQLIALLMIVSLAGCGNYSFTGANIQAKTLTITEFANNTDFGPANLSQQFTNYLKDYFLRNTSLNLEDQEGELRLEGIITGFNVTQQAPTSSGDPQGINTAALSRLTITVRVTFVNTLDEPMSFRDRSFSFFADFENTQNLVDVQDRLMETIFEQLALDIFNASVVNW